MKKVSMLRVASLVLVFALSFSLCAFAAEEKVDYGAKLDEARSLYANYGLFSDGKTDYIREALISMFEEDESLFYEFMEKIYSSRDRYSHYMKPEVYDVSYDLYDSMSGIGVSISANEEGAPIVTDVTYGGPAHEAGIMAGDIFATVDGVDVTNYLPAMIADLVKGKEGTTVRISVIRGDERKSFSVVREVLKVSSVSATALGDNIGYIKLSHFDGIDAFMDFMDAYEGLQENGANTYILDLRNNSGGDMSCLINLMDNIIPEKGIPYMISWQTKPMALSTYTSEGYGKEFNKFIILVNEYTASTAEMMAGALSDLGYAELVGQTTYGKGMAQLHVTTSSGDLAIVTAMQTKLPVRGNYDGEGLVPDHEVALETMKYPMPVMRPLKKYNGISVAHNENIYATEQRLYELGYLYTQPDEVYDQYTIHAINMFCKNNGLPQIKNFCKWEIVEKIDEAVQELAKKNIVLDTQLEEAIKIAKKYAEAKEPAKCIDMSKITFSD